MAAALACEIVLATAALKALYFAPATRAVRQHGPAVLSSWERLAARPSHILETQAEEFVYFSTVGLHHFVAGLMLFGPAVVGGPLGWMLFKWGTILELAFELGDLFAMLTQTYPFEKHNPKLVKLLLAHHVPGVLCIPPILYTNAHMEVPGIAVIASILLSAGGINMMVSTIGQLYDTSTKSGCRSLIRILRGTSVAFAVFRFVLYPMALLHVLYQCVVEERHALLALVALGSIFVVGFSVAAFKLNRLKIAKFEEVYRELEDKDAQATKQQSRKTAVGNAKSGLQRRCTAERAARRPRLLAHRSDTA